MRGLMIASVLAVALGGCAHAGDPSSDSVDATTGDPDPDPRPMPDATPACTPMTTQLLVNPAFDMTPQGMGWVEQRIQSGYPLVTPQDGRPEHTAPYKAWLGGFTGSSVTDVLTQDVAIPPMTKQLVLTGYHDVRTAEDPGETQVFDSASISIIQTDGQLIETVLTLSNLTPRTSWTSFNHTFTQGMSGQMVRLRFTSTNDGSRISSFYFDTLALTATHGCP
jgi:hypothetical protein